MRAPVSEQSCISLESLAESAESSNRKGVESLTPVEFFCEKTRKLFVSCWEIHVLGEIL